MISPFKPLQKIIATHPRCILWLIFVLAVSARMIVALSLENKVYFPDGGDYWHMSNNIFEGKGIVLNKQFQSLRSPGYPVFVSIIRLIDKENIFIVRVVQAFLGSFCVLGVFYLARQIFEDNRISFLAAFFMAFDPASVYFSNLVLYDTLLSVLLLIFIILLYLAVKRKDLWLSIGAGIMAGIMTLVSASMVLIVPFCFIVLFLAFNTRKNITLKLGVIFVSMMMVMSPWIFRNYKIHKTFILTTTQGGAGLYESVGPEANGGPVGSIVREKYKDIFDQKGEIELDQYWRQKAYQSIRDDPTRFTKLAIKKFFRMWSITINYQSAHPVLYNTVSIMFYLPIFLLLMASFFYVKDRWRNCLILIIPIVYKTMIHMVFIGSVRYRVPLMPFVSIMAAFALIQIFHTYSEMRRIQTK